MGIFPFQHLKRQRVSIVMNQNLMLAALSMSNPNDHKNYDGAYRRPPPNLDAP